MTGTHALVEREPALDALRGLLAEVTATGQGRLALVAGEPGAGKSAVSRAFAAALPPEVTLWWGACDSLRTARPLGPLVDVAQSAGGPLADALAAAAPRDVVFATALRLLQRPSPSVVVLEDVHWADEATLDLVSFLGRRLPLCPTVLLLTYRSDEVGADHPLRVVLGELATTRPTHVPVPRLSVGAVAAMAEGNDLDALELHRLTGGNPFFVSECLSAGVGEVPSTVRDAVLARRARLGGVARSSLDAAAVVPGRAELWLLEALGAEPAGVDECVDRGVLVLDGDGVAFRHELARLAVLDAIAPARRRDLHRRALARLAGPPSGLADHARLSHHAAAAGDVHAVLAHAPAAADAALALGARREAVAHLELALRHESALPVRERAELWVRLAVQRGHLARLHPSIEAFRTAERLFGEVGDDVARAATLVGLASASGTAGRSVSSREAGEEALAILEPLGPSPELAAAYGQRCSSHMLARELDEAEAWGQRALALAEQLGDDTTSARIRIQSGVARFMAGDDTGLARIHDGIARAERLGRSDLVCLGWSQIGSGGGEIRRYAEAVPALHRCIEVADHEDITSSSLYASAWLARCHLELGRWDDAADVVGDVLRSPRCTGISEMTALTVLGRLRARRGDPDQWQPLDRALELSRETGHLQRLWPVASARAEAAWLQGQLDREADLVQDVWSLAERLGFPWAREELAFWLWRAGRLEPPSAPGATPFSLHHAGRGADAAAAWGELGCPYEQALALADTDDVGAARAGLDTLVALGAAPAARKVADRVRALGGSVPRGPNRATLANPGTLTDRELEVLRLVAAGCSNPQVARQLGVSTKTVGHHVSHLLTKLGGRSRTEAVTIALARGIDLQV